MPEIVTEKDIQIEKKYNEVKSRLKQKYVIFDKPNPVPIIHCSKCACSREHKYIGEGKIHRDDVVFADIDSRNIPYDIAISGEHIGEIYQCSVCGEKRIFGLGKKSTELYRANHGHNRKGKRAA